MKKLGMSVALLALAGIAYAVQVNPTSNVLADTAATAGTIALRDSASSSLFSQIGLTVNTTTQLLTLVPAQVGQLTIAQFGAAGGTYTLCVSSGTGTGAWVYLSSASATSAGVIPTVCK